MSFCLPTGGFVGKSRLLNQLLSAQSHVDQVDNTAVEDRALIQVRAAG